MNNSIKIGYIYYTFFPVKGGASVHGYNLAQELNKLGYKLYKVNGDPDPYTKKLNKITGIFWILLNCDLIYLRLDYFISFRNLILFLALLFRTKVIVEINSPSDELLLHGYSKKYVHIIDWFYSKILKNIDATVVVSKPLRHYAIEQLNAHNVKVIENGGEYFGNQELRPNPEVKKQIQQIKNNYQSIAIWSGSVNKMQNLNFIQTIADNLSSQIALVIVSKHELKLHKENTFVFCALDRESVKYLIDESTYGLAFYNSDYSWCRWGFYNSSLKLQEFLNNGLLTLTNVTPMDKAKANNNLIVVNDPLQAADIINESRPQKENHSPKRTWVNVAQETHEIIQQVLKINRS